MGGLEWARTLQGKIETVQELFHQYHCGRIPDELSAELDRIVAHWFSCGRNTDEVMIGVVKAIAPVMPLMPDGAEITEWAENLDANTGLTLAEGAERFQQIQTELMMNIARMPQAPSVMMDVFSVFSRAFQEFVAREFHGNPERGLVGELIKNFEVEHPIAFALGDPSSTAEILQKAREANPN